MEDNGYPQPQSAFGQLFERYVNRVLVTTFILDGSDWIIYNRQDQDYATRLHAELGAKDICTSIGSAGFVASMERNDDESSGTCTAFEQATHEDILELQR